MTKEKTSDISEIWSQDKAKAEAEKSNIELNDDHWKVTKFLQDYHLENDVMETDTIQDALIEEFKDEGGLKYLYKLFPDGPIHQGSLIAGVEPPAGSYNKGFGSTK